MKMSLSYRKILLVFVFLISLLSFYGVFNSYIHINRSTHGSKIVVLSRPPLAVSSNSATTAELTNYPSSTSDSKLSPALTDSPQPLASAVDPKDVKCGPLTKELIRDFARNNTVMLTVCDFTIFGKLGISWLRHLEEQNFDFFLVGATDRRTARYLTARAAGHGKREAPCFLMGDDAERGGPVTGADPDDESERRDYKYNSEHYISATWQKVNVVRQMVDWGFNVIHSDVDVTWFRDPVKYFLGSTGAAGTTAADIMVSSDLVSSHNAAGDEGLEKYPSPTTNFNTGVYFVRGNEGGQAFMKGWYAERPELTKKLVNDQVGLYRLVRHASPLFQHERLFDFWPANDHATNGTVVHFGGMGAHMALNGYTYYLPRLNLAKKVNALCLHFTWVPLSLEGKLARMRDGSHFRDDAFYFLGASESNLTLESKEGGGGADAKGSVEEVVVEKEKKVVKEGKKVVEEEKKVVVVKEEEKVVEVVKDETKKALERMEKVEKERMQETEELEEWHSHEESGTEKNDGEQVRKGVNQTNVVETNQNNNSSTSSPSNSASSPSNSTASPSNSTASPSNSTSSPSNSTSSPSNSTSSPANSTSSPSNSTSSPSNSTPSPSNSTSSPSNSTSSTANSTSSTANSTSSPSNSTSSTANSTPSPANSTSSTANSTSSPSNSTSSTANSTSSTANSTSSTANPTSSTANSISPPAASASSPTSTARRGVLGSDLEKGGSSKDESEKAESTRNPAEIPSVHIPRPVILDPMTHAIRLDHGPIRLLAADIEALPTPIGYNTWVDTEDMILFHLANIEYQLAQVYRVLALAATLRRTVVLPRMRCHCYKNWFMTEQCRIPGDHMTAFPITCMLDQVFRAKKMVHAAPLNSSHGAFHFSFREYSFLDNPHSPKEFQDSIAKDQILVVPKGYSMENEDRKALTALEVHNYVKAMPFLGNAFNQDVARAATESIRRVTKEGSGDAKAVSNGTGNQEIEQIETLAPTIPRGLGRFDTSSAAAKQALKVEAGEGGKETHRVEEEWGAPELVLAVQNPIAKVNSVVQIPANLTQYGVVRALEPYRNVKVLRIRKPVDMFGGWDDQVLRESFEIFLKKISANWCCRDVPFVKMGRKEKENMAIKW